MSEAKEVKPDLRRCQADRNDESVILDARGMPRLHRCYALPAVIAYEPRPGRDGLVGCMSLCRECLDAMRGAIARGELPRMRFEDIPPGDMPGGDGYAK